jgi:hypothetical protein
VGWTIAFVVVAMAMLWPVALRGHPAYFFDTVGYYTGGRAALRAVRDKLDGLNPQPSAAHAAAAPSQPKKAVVATRAIAYAVFVRLAAGPDNRLIPLVLIQAGVVSTMLLLWLTRVAPGLDWRRATFAGVVLAAASSASWFASYAMPDIFLGVAILGFLVLMSPTPPPLGLLAKVFVVLVIGFAFAVHASHMPVLLLVTAFAVAQHLWLHRRSLRWPDLRAVVWLGAPLVVGAAAVIGSSLFGFSQASLAPKRLPFVLARSIADGPGRWYLERECPTRRYTICELYPVLPKYQAQILFGPTGLPSRATPAQMDAIRAEEPEIVAAAARAYPLQQAFIAFKSFGRQMISFGLYDLRFNTHLAFGYGETVRLEVDSKPPTIQRAFLYVIYGGVAASLAYLAWLMRRPRRNEAAMVLLVVITMLSNAAVTGILSAVAHRYQARVVWLLPALAIGLFIARRIADRTQARASPS